MEFIATPIRDAFEIRLSPFDDERGVFSRIFCQEELQQAGHQKNIVQINHSLNHSKGTIRGMHFQYPPFAETKIIRCLKGKIYDVMVDIRQHSDTFLKWHAVELSAVKYNMVYIPEGCAHGYQALEDDSELLYLHTEFYHRENEGALRFNDPIVGIQWPLPPVHVSDKDKNYPLLDESFSGIIL
jgi:dTDP-4-dehydrorhamnose 3,5-epimerase